MDSISPSGEVGVLITSYVQDVDQRIPIGV